MERPLENMTMEPVDRGIILVVDDSPVDRRLVGSMAARDLRMRVSYASNGVEALTLIGQQAPALVLTDLQMNQMDGLELVAAIRERHPQVPVVVMTAYGNEDVAVRALRAGAASYVPKRNLNRDLVSTVEQVLGAARSEQRDLRLFQCLSGSEFNFVLGNDATVIPSLVAYFQDLMFELGLCDALAKTRVGIALEEAMVNGVYHGNLELSSDLRQQDDNAFYKLAAERKLQSPYKDRRLHVHATLNRSKGEFTIRDEGPGFDPNSLPDPADPENFCKASGRGLLLIRAFMDEVAYNATGNEITMVKRAL